MKWFLKFFLCALLVLGAGNSSAATLDDGLNAFAAGEFEKVSWSWFFGQIGSEVKVYSGC